MRLEDEAALLHRRHLVRVVDIALGSERDPPRAFDHRDVAGLIVIMRTSPWPGANLLRVT